MTTSSNQANTPESGQSPIAVIEDRYHGTYSGGRFTAWNLPPEGIPHAISGDDETCRLFWQHARAQKWLIGIADTREEAIHDVRHKKASGYTNPKYLADWLP
ncbi:MAG: hypothetical protein WCR20_13390 [Verrucomicrobiota bacterium]